ncbi:MAG: hypothetical protein LBI60_04410 [Bacteroidales bacterium]|jgi:hypothetical protein|nr:hypothetical protein [Bacteroidales bacterium]
MIEKKKKYISVVGPCRRNYSLAWIPLMANKNSGIMIEEEKNLFYIYPCRRNSSLTWIPFRVVINE